MLSLPSYRSRQLLATFSAVAIALTTAAGSAGAVGSTSFNVAVSGSTTVNPIATALVNGFQSQYPDATVVQTDGGANGPGNQGSSVGIAGLMAGQLDVADQSKPISGGDDAPANPAQSKCPTSSPCPAIFVHSRDIDSWVIGLDAISLIVDSGVPSDVTNVTVSDIKGIYAGTITNWNQLSTPSATNLPIAHVWTRTAASGTYGDFNKFIGGGSFTPCSGSTCPQIATPANSGSIPGDSNPGLLNAVQTNSNSIAYVGYGFTHPTSGNPVRILNVDGITPNSGSTDTAIKNLVCVPPSGQSTCAGGLYPFQQAPAPDTVAACTSNPCANTVPPGAYPFGRQLFMSTIKPLACPASACTVPATRATNLPRAIQYVNQVLQGNNGTGPQNVLNEGMFGLLTHNPTDGSTYNPPMNFTCSSTGTGYCPQVIPPWNVTLSGVTNVSDVVAVGLAWQATPPVINGFQATHGWIRAAVNDGSAVNVGDVVTIGQHWQEAWNRWTD